MEKELRKTASYQSQLMSYQSDGLKIYVLVNKPLGNEPKTGFPVLIFGHGFHPEPKKYGVSTQTGNDWRPGDYYRGIPESYAEKGFLVLTPDYRGHNISEGFAYTQKGLIASNYYTIDLLHLLAALPSLEGGNLDNVFYMGHSLGGDVGLRMLLNQSQIKAASLWAPVAASTWEQALYYGKYYDDESDFVNPEKMESYTARLQKNIGQLDFPYQVEMGDPVNFIDKLSTPLIIHHALGDESVPYIWSESLVANLFTANKAFAFYSYDSKDHLLQNELREKAIARDIAFFNKHQEVK